MNPQIPGCSGTPSTPAKYGAVIEECPMRDVKNMVLSLANYILALLVMSSEILNSSFRILFLRKNQWLHETSDTKVQKIAWVIRVIIAGNYYMFTIV